MSAHRVPFRLTGSRAAQKQSSRSSSQSTRANQQAPHCRGRHNRSADSFSRTMEPSDSSPSHRSSGNKLKVRLVALLIQHVDGLAPSQLLAVIDVTKVQNMLLHHSATGNAFVLDNAPVAVLLAVFFPCLGAQEHDGR